MKSLSQKLAMAFQSPETEFGEHALVVPGPFLGKRLVIKGLYITVCSGR